MVGAPGFEPGASCAQGNCKKSILLVRLALFCVMVLGFGPNLSAFGPKWTQVFFQLGRRQAGAAPFGDPASGSREARRGAYCAVQVERFFLSSEIYFLVIYME